MNEWKVGIVGLSRGKGFVRVLDAHPSVTVTALCDVNDTRLAEVGEAFGLGDDALHTRFDDFLAADMDVVIVATPIAFHAEQTIAAIQSGRHVLCEQTAAYTVADCARVVEAVRSSDKQYMIWVST